MSKKVDSYRYVGYFTRKLIKAWIARESPHEIPWTPLAKPLADSTVALVSTAAVALTSDRPFDQEGERRDPWWGDPSYRVIPNSATEREVSIYHLHVDPSHAEQDLNCAFPLARLQELARDGVVGESAPSHYSYMGYILRPRVLLEESTPAMIERMKAEQVDVVLLVPF